MSIIFMNISKYMSKMNISNKHMYIYISIYLSIIQTTQSLNGETQVNTSMTSWGNGVQDSKWPFSHYITLH